MSRATQTGEVGGGDTTVVVVEDEDQLADLYTLWLSEDYDVRTARTGQEALDAIDTSTDVVLLDRRLPDISGDEVLGRIREAGIDCRVAMVTAVDPSSDLLKLDIDEYVQKPVTETELLDVVEELVTRSDLEASLQDYLALASKKETLEAEHSARTLQSSRRYEALTDELTSRRSEFTDKLSDQAKREETPVHHYSRREISATVLGLSLIALVLVAVHFFVPDAIERLFGTGTPDPSLAESYLASFVHANDAHLGRNVASYLVVAVLTYVLCLRMLAVRWFYVTTVVLLTLLPVVTAVLVYDVFAGVYDGQELLFVGFSHVVSGFVGFSLLAFLALLRLLYRPRSVVFVAGFVLSMATGLVLWLDGVPGFPVAAIGAVLCFGGFLVERLRALKDGREEGQAILANLGIIAVAGWLYAVLGLGLVPTVELGADQGVLGHLVGLGCGFGIALASALLLNVFPIRPPIERTGYRLPDRIL